MTPGLQSVVWRFKALGPPQLSALAGHWPSAPCPASGQSPFQGGPTGSPKGSMPSGHGGCYTQAGPTGTSGRWPCPPWLPNTAPSLAQMAGHNWAPWQRQSPSHKERGVPGKKDMSCIFQLSFVHSRAAGTLGQRLHRTLAYPMDAVPTSAGWRHTNTQHRGPGPSVAEPRGLPAPKQQRGKRDVLIPERAVGWAVRIPAAGADRRACGRRMCLHPKWPFHSKQTPARVPPQKPGSPPPSLVAWAPQVGEQRQQGPGTGPQLAMPPNQGS